MRGPYCDFLFGPGPCSDNGDPLGDGDGQHGCGGSGSSRATVTNAAGRYRIPEFGLGLYSVEAQITGFQTEVRSGIRLTVGREAVVDLELKVGAITERVEVTAEAPLVQTKDSAVSYLVDENTMRDLRSEEHTSELQS